MFNALKRWLFGTGPSLDEKELGIAMVYAFLMKKKSEKPVRTEPRPLPEPKLFLDDTEMPPKIRRSARPRDSGGYV